MGRVVKSSSLEVQKKDNERKTLGLFLLSWLDTVTLP